MEAKLIPFEVARKLIYVFEGGESLVVDHTSGIDDLLRTVEKVLGLS
jgi:hypothetical protein